jgi:hypothetical protein
MHSVPVGGPVPWHARVGADVLQRGRRRSAQLPPVGECLAAPPSRAASGCLRLCLSFSCLCRGCFGFGGLCCICITVFAQSDGVQRPALSRGARLQCMHPLGVQFASEASSLDVCRTLLIRPPTFSGVAAVMAVRAVSGRGEAATSCVWRLRRKREAGRLLWWAGRYW